jgi:N-methylhydantoinase A
MRATVTDANVVLGRLDGGNFLGGGMSLDEVAARRVIGELARELGLSDREAAEGVITLINANMANAIRSRTVQKGIDPRNYALVAFGGAGPLHGAEVADMLGVTTRSAPRSRCRAPPTLRASMPTSTPWQRNSPDVSGPTESIWPR